MLSLSDIKNLFKGNARSKTIQTATLREAFGSLVNPHGSLYLTVTASTDVSGDVAGTFFKAAGTTTLSGSPYLLSMPANNRLQYDGDKTRHFHIAASISMSCTGAGQDVQVAIAKNGVVDTGSIVTRKTSNANDIGSTAVHADFEMSQGDYLELWVANTTNNANAITIENLYLFGLGMFM